MKSSFRFLFFLYHYPPLPGISPKRNYQISSEIARVADLSIIFTSAEPNPQIENKTSVRVQKIPVFDYRYIIRKKNESGAVEEHHKTSKWFRRAIKLMNTFPFNLLIAEGGPIYFINLVSKGNRAIREHRITHLYSSFRTFTDHFAAYILKRMHPDIYWIADFRDLLIDPYFNHLYFKGVHQGLFKKIFKQANLLTTVSNGLAQHLKKYNQNVITVRNGIINFPADFTPSRCSSFTIAYTGSMYLDKKNALPLFAALKELIEEGRIEKTKVNIIYAGKDSYYWEDMATSLDLLSIMDFRGNLSSEDAMQIQKNACVNLLLTISSPELTGITTGKMIEYLEAGSPVLGIVVHRVDPELESILQELQIGKSFSDQDSDLPGIKQFIYDEYLLWEKTGTNRKPVNTEILKSKYSVEATMKPLFEKIELHPSLPLNPLKGTSFR